MDIIMKTCTQCGQTKPITEFHKAGLNPSGTQRYRSTCKTCANAREAERYREKKNFIDTQKTKCAKCGDDRPYVLDFHHRDPNEKEFTIGKIKKKDCDVLQSEIDKCVILCANCHREFHYFNKLIGISLEDWCNGNTTGSEPVI